MSKTDGLIHCEDCKHLKNSALVSSYSNNINSYYCDSPTNEVPKDGWLRKVPLTNGPQRYPWDKNANNDCKDFEPLYKENAA